MVMLTKTAIYSPFPPQTIFAYSCFLIGCWGMVTLRVGFAYLGHVWAHLAFNKLPRCCPQIMMNAGIMGHAVRSVWTRRDRTDALAQMASACRPTDDPAKPKQVSPFIIHVSSSFSPKNKNKKCVLSNMYFTLIFNGALKVQVWE